MKVLHTADWHLGRRLCGRSLLEDQRLVLDRITGIAVREKPDLIVIAGDVYDRAIPGAEAVRLLDDVLSTLVQNHGFKVLLIAGNHDGPDRLGFASGMLESMGLHIVGPLDPAITAFDVTDRHGPVRVIALPYTHPAVVRELLDDSTVGLHDHEAAMAALVARAREKLVEGERCILVAHAFVAGGQSTEEAERELSVGGAGEIPTSIFNGFSYVALGHLHRPQTHGTRQHVHYAGSPLKYSFHEDHQKSVSVVEICKRGMVTIRQEPLTPIHDVRSIEGRFDDLITRSDRYGPTDDYLEIVYTDDALVSDAAARLAGVYPHCLAVRRKEIGVAGELGGISPADARILSLEDLFKQFYADVTGNEIGAEHTRELLSVIDDGMKGGTL
ncbi:MAG TPA: exonuclease SbcCD subunit D [Armatimonadota bacterium]|jgi:exonuclease SbcD